MTKVIDNQEVTDIQAQIDDLQQILHDEVQASDLAFDLQKNPIFESRNEAITSLIAAKDIPQNFWGATLVSLLQLKAKAEEAFPHFLGPYDEELLTNHLKDIRVVYTDKGHKISLFFSPNPFFTETQLWAEVLDVMSSKNSVKHQSNSEDEEEDEEWEEKINFSGITWNPGCGPEDDTKDDERDGDDHRPTETSETGTQKSEEGPAVDNASRSHKGTNEKRGPSVLEVFSSMPPSPEEDSELYNEDDDEGALMKAVEEWEDEMEDRKLLLNTMIEAYYTPEVVWTNVENFKEVEMVLKKVKTE